MLVGDKRSLYAQFAAFEINFVLFPRTVCKGRKIVVLPFHCAKLRLLGVLNFFECNAKRKLRDEYADEIRNFVKACIVDLIFFISHFYESIYRHENL